MVEIELVGAAFSAIRRREKELGSIFFFRRMEGSQFFQIFFFFLVHVYDMFSLVR